MPNRMEAVDAVVREKNRGWPYGSGDAHKYIPALLARIQELENALNPFAHVAYVNANVPPANGMQLVMWNDLERAREMLDPSRSHPVTRETFFDIPAE